MTGSFELTTNFANGWVSVMGTKAASTCVEPWRPLPTVHIVAEVIAVPDMLSVSIRVFQNCQSCRHCRTVGPVGPVGPVGLSDCRTAVGLSECLRKFNSQEGGTARPLAILTLTLTLTLSDVPAHTAVTSQLSSQNTPQMSSRVLPFNDRVS